MSTITFDSDRLVADLEASGIPIAQARAVVRGIVEAQSELVTRDILQQELVPIRTDLAVVKTELLMQRWMLGFLMAGVLSLMIKAFI